MLFCRASRKLNLRHLRDTSDPFSVTENIFIEHYRLSKSCALHLINFLKDKIDVPLVGIPFHLIVLSALFFIVMVPTNVPLEQTTT